MVSLDRHLRRKPARFTLTLTNDMLSPVLSIKAIVSILTPVSTVASVADSAGLVRQEVLILGPSVCRRVYARDLLTFQCLAEDLPLSISISEYMHCNDLVGLSG